MIPVDNIAEFELNSVKYLHLRELRDSEKSLNSLRIIVEEAAINQAAVANLGHLKNARPIESVDGGKLFELSWKLYVAYLITEELVGSNAKNGYDDECYTGKLLRLYTKSHFLAHLARDTGGHTGDILHFKLICLDHLIDVASCDPPVVRRIDRECPSEVH